MPLAEAPDREEWWTVAIHYPDGVGGGGSFQSLAAAVAHAQSYEALGYGCGNERQRGRIKISHYTRERWDWIVSPETAARIEAEDAVYEEKRKRRTR